MYKIIDQKRIGQGDLFRQLTFKYISSSNDTIEITYPFWFIISQDCDLEHDYKSHNGDYENEDKNLTTVLAVPAFLALDLKNGTHMSSVNEWKMQYWNSDLYKHIKSNSNSRFHFLAASEEHSLPELIIDFKHFHTLPRDYLYSKLTNRNIALDDLYKESVSDRFTHYLARIALPDGSSL